MTPPDIASIRPLSRRALLGALALPAAARAQSAWPDRPLRWISPSPAGSAADVLSRLVADRLAPRLGQPVVVENRPGAGTNIGMAQLARAAPDGTTLGMASAASHAANRWLHANLPFDPVRDFAPIGLIAVVPNIMVVPPASPVRDVAGFIAWGRAQGRPLNLGTVGTGSSQHLAGVQFTAITGIRITDIAYNQAGQMNTDLIEGRLDLLFQSISAVAPLAQAGRMRPIAVSGTERVAAFPDLPTLREQGVDITTMGWFGLVAPAGVPDQVLERLDATLTATLEDPGVQERILAGGSVPRILRREAFARFMAEETARLGAIIQAAGLRAG